MSSTHTLPLIIVLFKTLYRDFTILERTLPVVRRSLLGQGNYNNNLNI